MKKPRIFNINTTAYTEENFLLLTNLTPTQIVKVITPIVNKERREKGEYNNDDLVSALKTKYPTNLVEMYVYDDLDMVTI